MYEYNMRAFGVACRPTLTCSWVSSRVSFAWGQELQLERWKDLRTFGSMGCCPHSLGHPADGAGWGCTWDCSVIVPPVIYLKHPSSPSFPQRQRECQMFWLSLFCNFHFSLYLCTLTWCRFFTVLFNNHDLKDLLCLISRSQHWSQSMTHNRLVLERKSDVEEII